MDQAGDTGDACEWLAAWLRNEPLPRWRGPGEVVLRTRTLEIELGPGKPVRQSAPPGHCFRLRIAPDEHPPATLHLDRDTSAPDVVPILFVPPSLRDSRER